jgi:hypothetical protein
VISVTARSLDPRVEPEGDEWWGEVLTIRGLGLDCCGPPIPIVVQSAQKKEAGCPASFVDCKRWTAYFSLSVISCVKAPVGSLVIAGLAPLDEASRVATVCL